MQARGGYESTSLYGRGSSTPRPVSLGRSVCGSNTHQKLKWRKLTGWKEIQYIDPCDTPANPDDIPDPNPPGGGAGRSSPPPPVTAIPYEISEFIVRDTMMVEDLVWEGFVIERRGQGYLSDLGGVEHRAFRLIRQYHHRGFVVVLLGKQCVEG